ncbi:hypothetical protein KKG36_02565 [Patescibacteria group bacterium]|nr:hypothetical protein [Patescibacteria group bacterium]
MIKNIICVDRRNVCRGPMLQGLLQQKTGPTVVVESAGTFIGCALAEGGASPHAITCMQNRGIDIRGHRCRRVIGMDLNKFHLIVCMTTLEVGIFHNQLPSAAILQADTLLGNGETIPYTWGQVLLSYEFCAELLEPIADRIFRTYLS